MTGYIAKGITNGIDDIVKGGAGALHICTACHQKGKCKQACKAGKFLHHFRHPGHV